MWVFDKEKKVMTNKQVSCFRLPLRVLTKRIYRDITFVPGLYKIVDEILVNAADNKVRNLTFKWMSWKPSLVHVLQQRDASMDLLKVTVDPEKNTISVMNNGAGIPIEVGDSAPPPQI